MHDISALKEEFYILVSRYVPIICADDCLHCYLVYFNIVVIVRILVVYDVGEFEDCKLIPRHIQSRYSKEMASKSEVVSSKVTSLIMP